MSKISKDIGTEAEEKQFAFFCQALGISSFSAKGRYWRSVGLRMYTPVPAHRPISFTREEMRHMWRQGACFIHYPSDGDMRTFPGHVWIQDEKKYDLDSINSSNRRYNIRRAFKHCAVEETPFELLVKSAAPLIEDTYGRTGRNYDRSVSERWNKYFRCAAPSPLFEAWGTFVGGKIAAFLSAFTYQGGVHIESVFSHKDLLKYYPVNALVFVFTQQAINRDGISYVSYGQRPITGEHESLMSFKESMGYKKIPLKERLEVNPLVRPAFSHPLRSALDALAGRYYHRSEYARIVSGVISTLKGQR